MPATASESPVHPAARIIAAASLLVAALLLVATLASTVRPTMPALADTGASAPANAVEATEAPEPTVPTGRIAQVVRALRATQSEKTSPAAPTVRAERNEQVGQTMQATVDQAVRSASETILAAAERLGLAVARSAETTEPAAPEEPGAAFLTCNLDLTVNGQVVATVNAETVRPWIVVGADGSAWVDDYALARWVDGVEAVIDSVWATRSYLRPDGKWVTVAGGTYGWISNGAQLDQIVRDAVYNGTVGSCEVPMKQTAAVFNPGGQDWGRYVDVDISEQYVRFYDWDGSLIWESPCITGIPDGVHETPTGVYAVTRKDTDQVLRGPYDPETDTYEYESFVQWWMPFIGNMVGLHDASWQPGFSSDAYLYRGSHGCVNLPVGNAYQLFCLIEVGDVVVTHY